MKDDITLTERENAVLFGMSYGHTNRQIAANILVSEDTVKTHARRMFRKIGAADRAHAVRIGFELGLLTPYAPSTPETVTLTPATPRQRSDQHIAACFAAESCPCRTGSTWSFPDVVTAEPSKEYL